MHKAKGLEFDTVHVLDDFVKVPCARHNLAQLPHFRVGKETACPEVPLEELPGMFPLDCPAFCWMVWPLGRILLEKSPKLLVLNILFLYFIFRKTELAGSTSLRAASWAVVVIVALFNLRQLFTFGLFTLRRWVPQPHKSFKVYSLPAHLDVFSLINSSFY